MPESMGSAKASPPQANGGSGRVAALVDRLVAWMARHWLAIFNAIVAVFITLPFLAPVLMHLGLTRAGTLIYTIYSPTCHQLPERSFFLFGPSGAYSTAELETMRALPAGLSIFQREMLRYIGNPEIGYKVAFCERDVAIYGAILLAGLLFGAVRARYQRDGKRIPKLPLKAYALMSLPMVIDGATQLFGLRESTWWLRLLTGGLFGAATVWLAYPYVQEAMEDVVRTSPTRAHPQTGQSSTSEV